MGYPDRVAHRITLGPEVRDLMPSLSSKATRRSIGNVVAPARFIAFAVLLVLVGGVSIWFAGWRLGFMIGFDVASATFLLSCYGLLDDAPSDMRANAKRNDANRAALLALTFVMGLLILTIIASELMEKGSAGTGTIALIVLTLVLAWIFSNTVYTVHYAHLFYTNSKDETDFGGLEFPQTDEPNYWDFIYFSFCLGMTFQTSDVEVTSTPMRRAVTSHCLAAFIFNIGILAFSINSLSG